MEKFLELSISGICTGALYSLIALGIVLVYKATHVVSLAHGGLMAMAALFFFFLMWEWELPLALAIILGVLFGALLGYIINRTCLQPLIGQPLMSAFLITFAIFQVLGGLFQLILGGYSRGLPPFLPSGELMLAGVAIDISRGVSCLIALVVFGGVWAFFQYSKTGLAMRATAEEHKLAQSTGIRVKQIFSWVWMISAVMCVVAGLLLAAVVDISWSLADLGIIALAVALFGGMDSIHGALVAGLVVGFLQNLGGGYVDTIVGGGFADLTAFIVLLLVLLIKPYGLFGEVRIERI